MTRSMALSVCVIALGTIQVSSARADAVSAFEQVYGEQLRKTVATADTRDDAELAKSLVEAAKTSTSDQALQVVLLEKAYELGMKNLVGQATATEAARMLAQLLPDRRAQYMEKIAAAAQMLYTRSTGAAKQKAGEELVGVLLEIAESCMKERDASEAVSLLRRASAVASALHSERSAEVQYHFYVAQARQKVDQKFASLKARLAKDPKDTEARNQLLLMELVEYADLEAAGKLVAGDADETLRTYVPLAAQDPKAVAEQTCLELAEWMRKLPPSDASMQGRLNALTKACEYYNVFLERHAQNDSMALLARKNLGDLSAECDALQDRIADSQGGLAGFLKDIRVLSEGRNVGNRLAIAYCGKSIVQTTEGFENMGLTLAAFRCGKLVSVECYHFGQGRGWPPRREPGRDGEETTDPKEARTSRFAEAIAALPRCTYVVLAVRHDATRNFTEQDQKAIESVGGKVGLLKQAEYSSYYCIGRKGLAPGSAVERCASASICYPPGSVAPVTVRPVGPPTGPMGPTPGPRWRPPGRGR